MFKLFFISVFIFSSSVGFAHIGEHSVEYDPEICTYHEEHELISEYEWAEYIISSYNIYCNNDEQYRFICPAYESCLAEAKRINQEEEALLERIRAERGVPSDEEVQLVLNWLRG